MRNYTMPSDDHLPTPSIKKIHSRLCARPIDPEQQDDDCRKLAAEKGFDWDSLSDSARVWLLIEEKIRFACTKAGVDFDLLPEWERRMLFDEELDDY